MSHRNRLTVAILLLCLPLIGCSQVQEVTIQGPESPVEKGTSRTLQAQVTGEGGPDTTVTWAIVERVTAGTGISDDGVLTVAADEPAHEITVTATSVQDESKSATVRIALSVSKSLFLGQWSSVVDGIRYTLDLRPDTLRVRSAWGETSRASDLRWTRVINDDLATKGDFAEGYVVSGTFFSRFPYFRADGTRVWSGSLQRYRFFISPDAHRMLLRNADGFWVLTRQDK